MKYEEIALHESLELSDAELGTIVGAGQHHGWSEADNDHDGGWWRRCRRRNRNQDFGGQGYGSQDFGGQIYGYGSQDFGGQGYDGDDWQRRCRRR